MFFATLLSTNFSRNIFIGIQLCDQNDSHSDGSFIPALSQLHYNPTVIFYQITECVCVCVF